ncbi:MAG: Zn-ribbon domain-containing OB-fold protein [Elusimicrobia bacterium]|nr:Zn-ribbon domain-containing OB-fold protein [Elusimicrobiota bacterium]
MLTKQKPMVLKGQLPLKNLYTAGLAGNDFLHALKKGEILSSACHACGTTYVPARYFCERCFENISQNYKSVSPQGELVSWTGCYVGLNGKRSSTPAVVGAIRLYGASTVFVHFLKVPKANLRTGLKVQAVFKPESKRVGSILDISYFAPAK